MNSLLRSGVLLLGLTSAVIHAQDTVSASPVQPPTVLKSLVFEGNQIIASPDLLQALAPYLGQPLNEALLKSLRQGVSRAYQARGYGLVDIQLPEQDLTEGFLRIAVQEITLSQATINNESAADLSAFGAALANFQGKVAPTESLERLISLIKERPGVQEVQPVIASSNNQTSAVDLTLGVRGARTSRLGVGVDNYGSPMTGRNRTVVDFEVSPLPGLDGTLLGSWGASSPFLQSHSGTGNTNTGFLRYEQPVGADGLKVMAYHNSFVYALADSLGGSTNQGHAKSLGLGLVYPVVLESQRRLNVSLAIEHANMSDKQFVWDVQKNTRANKLGLDGYVVHGVGGSGAQINYSLDVKSGTLAYDNPALATLAPAGVLGQYVKINSMLQESVAVNEQDVFTARWTAQVSNTNLDASERLGMTGPSNVRGFTSNVMSVDAGNLLTLEYKHRFQDTGFWSSVFYDYANGQINYAPSASSGVNRVRLSSVGAGLGWSLNQWTIQAQWVAKQQASTVLAAKEPANQFWLMARFDMKN